MKFYPKIRSTALWMAIAFFGCKQSGSTPDSTDSKKAPEPKTSPSTSAPSNTNPSTSPVTGVALASAQMKVIQPSGSQALTLLDMVKASGKTLGVFQFSGVTCTSCKEESPKVTAVLAAYAKDVQMFVLFPNGANEYKPDEYGGFISNFASGAKYGIDSDMSVLKSIRKNNKQFFGLYIILKKDGTGVVLRDDDAVSKVGTKVKDLLGSAK